MKKFKLLVSLLAIFIAAHSFAQSGLSKYSHISGYWQSLDENTHLPSAAMYIWKRHGLYYAKIAKIYPIGTNNPKDVCKKCVGAKHNQRIQGMTVMTGMKQVSSNSYDGGKILDPRSGSNYHCKLTLLPSGLRLKVRGYIGISLFGKTQVWQRLSGINSKHPIHPLET
jgi:uncharacterized protein (DUF2147 family)